MAIPEPPGCITANVNGQRPPWALKAAIFLALGWLREGWFPLTRRNRVPKLITLSAAPSEMIQGSSW
jgi:hypothetical protein